MPATPSRGGSRRVKGQERAAGGEKGLKLGMDHTVKARNAVSHCNHNLWFCPAKCLRDRSQHIFTAIDVFFMYVEGVY